MHELVVVKQMMNTVIKHADDNNASKITVVHLVVGELRDFVDVWVRKYFVFASKGTIAEGAQINITRIPGLSVCECGANVQVTRENIFTYKCSNCGSEKLNLIHGLEYQISGIEVANG